MRVKPFSYKKFQLGDHITKEQIDFFNKNGFLHFTEVLSKDEVNAILDSYDKASEALIKSKTTELNGIPLFYGKDDKGKTIIHRFPFFSQHSKPMHEFITSKRVKPLLSLLEGYNPRIVEDEK